MIEVGTVDNPDRRGQLAFQVEYAGSEGVWNGADRVVVKTWGVPASAEMDEGAVAVLSSLTAEQARDLAHYLMSAAHSIDRVKKHQDEVLTAQNI